MRLIPAILTALFVCTTAWARVDKLPSYHDENVARTEAARNAPPSDPPWDGRPGTIKHAMEQPDGTLVTLDCVHVGPIYKEPQKYIVIYDWYTSWRTMIVNIPATPEMRPGQVIDVIGTMATLSDGRRLVEYPTILGYSDKQGKLLVQGGPMIKGISQAIPWAYKIQLTKIDKPEGKGKTTTSTRIRAADATTISDSIIRIKDLTTYDSVAELLAAKPTEGKWVRLRDRRVYCIGKDDIGTFIVVRDGDSEDKLLQVYTTARPKTKSANVTRIIGKVHVKDGSIVLETDIGSTIDPQIAVGSVAIID